MIVPKRISIAGNPDADWSAHIWDLWEAEVSPKFIKGQWCSHANYYTPRPYRNEYDRGSKKEGFTYVVEPGTRVCFWEKEVRK